MESHSFNTWIANGISLAAIGTTLLGILPAFAAGVALLWYLIQIYESATVQTWLKARRVRKLARMKAQVIMLQAKLTHPDTLPAMLDDGE